MKKAYLLIPILSILFFTGCGPKVISVPTENINIDNYTKEDINKNNNADLTIYVNMAGIDPVIVKIDNQIIEKMSSYTYSYHELEKGFHWIAANGAENDSFLCKEFTKGKYIVNVDNGFGIADVRFYLKEKNNIDEINKKSKQIVQKQKYVKKISVKPDFNGVFIKSDSQNEKILDLVKVLNQNLKGQLSPSLDENHLILDISLVDFKDGNSFGRWMFGGMDEAKKYADSLSIKTDIIYNNQVIDTIYSSKIIKGGIFGGSASSIIKNIADEITSYTMCKFYNTQFPEEQNTSK